MLGPWIPAQPTNSFPLCSWRCSSSVFLVGLWHGLRSERTAQSRLAWDPAHIVWVHLGKPVGFTMVETNPDRHLHCSRVGCEVRVVGIILADTRLKGDEFLAIRDSFMCVAVHPCRVNQTIRIATFAVMDHLESFARLLDNFNRILIKYTKISVSDVGYFPGGVEEGTQWCVDWTLG